MPPMHNSNSPDNNYNYHYLSADRMPVIIPIIPPHNIYLTCNPPEMVKEEETRKERTGEETKRETTSYESIDR